MKIKPYTIIHGLIFFCILFSFLSCGEEGRSIFWTIANSEKEQDFSLDNNLTIIAMTDDGSIYYISAGGSIWYHDMDLSDGDWEKIKFPENAIHCTALEYYDSTLYAAFILDTGRARLYSTTTPTTKPVGWTRVVHPLIKNKQIIKLKEENSLLFISLQEPPQEDEEDPQPTPPPPTYSLYYYNGTDFFSITKKVTNKSKPILDITWNGTKYWAIIGPELFEIEIDENSPKVCKVTKIEDFDSEGDFGGVLHQHSSGRTYISSDRGNVYIYDGSSWDFLGDKKLVEVDGKVVSFTGLMRVNSNILIGTQGYGFYEMRNGTLESLNRAGVDDDMKSILSSDLYTSNILSFYKTPPDLIFFCTGGDGLYHNTYNGTEWTEDWDRE